VSDLSSVVPGSHRNHTRPVSNNYSTSISQVRTIRYRQIADDLDGRLDAGEFVAGGLLPSESDLSAHYDASRVTVRRALELLRDQGRVDSRQGFGWFVPAHPVRQSLSTLGTLDEQLAADGATSEREVLAFAFVSPPEWVAERFGESAESDTQLLEVRRRTLADGQPFARVTVWCPETLGSELSRSEVERHPFVQLLDVRIGGATQTIGADAASAEDAELLEVPEGSPVLRIERVTESADGEVVLVSEHVYPAHRTEFVVDLPADVGDGAPAGLRLLS